MGRLIAIQVGLFLLPFFLFWLYVKIGRKVAFPRPTGWLVLAGLALAVAGFLVAGTQGGRPPGSDFERTRVEDGRLIRGR